MTIVKIHLLYNPSLCYCHFVTKNVFLLGTCVIFFYSYYLTCNRIYKISLLSIFI